MVFAVENPGLRLLDGAVMEFAVKLGSGLAPADVTLTVDSEVGARRWPAERRGSEKGGDVEVGGCDPMLFEPRRLRP